MRSRHARFLALLLIGGAVAFSARHANASYVSSRPGLGEAAVALQVFGSFSPGIADESRWGYGVALRTRLSDRLAFALDASRLSGGGRSIAPFGAGFLFGPGASGPLHPWVEAGGAYYRVTDGSGVRPAWALSAAGNPRDSFANYSTESPSHAWGPYFGMGVDWAITARMGLFGGARAYNWSTFGPGGQWDGVVAFRSGLTLRL